MMPEIVALRHLEADAPNGANRAVSTFDVGQLEQGRGLHYARFLTKGSARRRNDMSSEEPR
jgi:hypothetical protein